MGTIADKLLYLDGTKTALRDAINAAGGALTVSTPFRQYTQWVLEQGATLDLNFIKQSYIAKTSALVPDRIGFSNIITFTRASGGGRFNSSGVYEWLGNDVPRLDYDPVTLAPRGILIEEQRTNLLTYSEQFDNAVWQKFAAIVTPNTSASPDGTSSADKLIADATNASHYIRAAFSFTSGTSYTLTVFAKAAERSMVGLTLPAVAFGGVDQLVAFDLVAKTAHLKSGSATFSILDIGGGWYRCSITSTATATISNAAYIFLLTPSGTTVFLGDGTSGIYIWGAQLEAGAFPTSYIPTVASQVTRSADGASVNTLSPWYNATEGTLFVGASTNNTTTSGFPILAVLSSDANNYISLNHSGGNLLRAEIRSSGVLQALLSSSVTLGMSNKIAAAYKLNDFAASVNGGALPTDTSGTVPPVATLRLGAGPAGTLILNGHIRSLRYFPRRLTNAELQTLTTP